MLLRNRVLWNRTKARERKEQYVFRMEGVACEVECVYGWVGGWAEGMQRGLRKWTWTCVVSGRMVVHRTTERSHFNFQFVIMGWWWGFFTSEGDGGCAKWWYT